MRCPNCGGPGGIQLLTTVSICTRCENGKRMRDAPPGLTMSDLGVRTSSKVRFVPITGGRFPGDVKLQTVAKAGTWPSYSGGYGEKFRDMVIKSLNSGVPDRNLNSMSHDPKSWSWHYKAERRDVFAIDFGIADLGEDQSNWYEVPKGIDWGQKPWKGEFTE